MGFSFVILMNHFYSYVFICVNMQKHTLKALLIVLAVITNVYLFHLYLVYTASMSSEI